MWRRVLYRTCAVMITMALSWIPVMGQEVGASNSPGGKKSPSGSLEIGAHIKLLMNPDFEREDRRTQRDESFLTGTLKSCQDGMLILRPDKSDADVVRVPLDQVESLYVGRGKSGGNTLAGAAIGLALGSIIALATQTGPSECEGFLCEIDEGVERSVVALVIVATGTAVGAVIGSSLGREEKWKRAFVDEECRYLQSSLPGEFKVAAGFSF